MNTLSSFYEGKRVLLTGHTGFKGSWMSLMLNELGAKVIGYSLDPKSDEDLFVQAEVSKFITDVRGNVLDSKELLKTVTSHQPEIVFHFAAQPLVIESYINPLDTWKVNLIGTLNLLEAINSTPSIKSIVIITTDKVYKNNEKKEGYFENDPLGGQDPYSASKAAVELAVSSWRDSYFYNFGIGIATARAGNVIGGGDWSDNRLIPDFFRAYYYKKPFVLRNPNSIRPWQHVLDVLNGYLILGRLLYLSPNEYSTAFNFGPKINNNISSEKLISILSKYCPTVKIQCESYKNKSYIETNKLFLNSNKSVKELHWTNKYNVEEALYLTNLFYTTYKEIGSLKLMLKQIRDYYAEFDLKSEILRDS